MSALTSRDNPIADERRADALSTTDTRATAAAVAALVMAEQYGHSDLSRSTFDYFDAAYRGDLSELLLASLHWIADRQNADGGWSRQSGGPSDLTTSLLVLSAFRMTCVPAADAECEPRLEQYVKKQGGIAAFRRQPIERGKQLGILAACAAAGLLSWKQLPVIRFERAAAPDLLKRLLQQPQFDQNDPVLLAYGLARFHRAMPVNPAVNWLRKASIDRALRLIRERQSPDGAFQQSVLATSSIVTSLASAGYASNSIVRHAVEHLLSSVLPDASWRPLPRD
ncbi:MAG: hypothetical protein KDA37_11145 [Planctomycetales bacterium]|nr:hypothetical protein [Planctomycetales bacterium]